MNNVNGGDGGMTMMNHNHMMMQMAFFWGKNTEILFIGWPGYDNLGMYILALIVIFFLAIFIEFLSHSNYINENANNVTAGFRQTTFYGLRIGLAYVEDGFHIFLCLNKYCIACYCCGFLILCCCYSYLFLKLLYRV